MGTQKQLFLKRSYPIPWATSLLLKLVKKDSLLSLLVTSDRMSLPHMLFPLRFWGLTQELPYPRFMRGKSRTNVRGLSNYIIRTWYEYYIYILS